MRWMKYKFTCPTCGLVYGTYDMVQDMYCGNGHKPVKTIKEPLPPEPPPAVVGLKR